MFLHPLTKDLTGQTFGRLTVLKFDSYGVRKTTMKKFSNWLCQCECGTLIVIENQSLKSGDTKSCGCLHTESNGSKSKNLSLPNNLGDIRKLYRRYYFGAKSRHLDFFLTEREFIDLVFSKCFYCGEPPSRSIGKIHYNGIDRLANDVGYIVENCVPCCTVCNFSKRERSYEEFISWIRKVYDNQS